MNKEIDDALCMLLHCSLKDKKYTTQKEQADIIRKHIINLEQALHEIREYIENHTENIDRGAYYEDYVETYDILQIIDKVLGDDEK